METNRFKRAWIWLWYNDLTRLVVVSGLPVIPVGLILNYLFGSGEYIRHTSALLYISLIFWAVLDNNYSNLRRIGLDEHRHKLPPEQLKETI